MFGVIPLDTTMSSLEKRRIIVRSKNDKFAYLRVWFTGKLGFRINNLDVQRQKRQYGKKGWNLSVKILSREKIPDGTNYGERCIMLDVTDETTISDLRSHVADIIGHDPMTITIAQNKSFRSTQKYISDYGHEVKLGDMIDENIMDWKPPIVISERVH